VAVSSSEACAAGLIRLGTGTTGAEWSALPWRAVAALAVRERCTALAWLRSRDTILRHADAEVAQAWRDLALRMLARGHGQVEALATLTTALSTAGVECAVLKGAPLSAMLYGEPGARASADLDLWVPVRDRAAARVVLLDHGWQLADGDAPNDEAYRQAGAHGEHYLEVHSQLLHSRLSYLPFPAPEVATAEIAGHRLPVMTGALLPAYLAVHIARHRAPPALWFIDYHTLWGTLDDDARRLARWTARQCRADRYLDWILRRTNSVDAAVRGKRFALSHVGLQPERRDFHPMWRQMRLAPWPDGPLRALRAWLAPQWVSLTPLEPGGFVRRIRRHWRSAIGTGDERARRARASTVVARDVTVGGEQLLRVARDVSRLGGRMWITTTGTSMCPTLIDGDQVLVEAAARVTVGDIVLVNSAGAPLLHRIVETIGDRITTRGDARMTRDASVSRDDVIARAIRARRGTAEWSLAPSQWRRLRLRLASRGMRKTLIPDSRATA
jgi:hypothetical protein